MRPRVCPFCGGNVPNNVTQCEHCGRYFDGTVTPEDVPVGATHLVCILDRSGSMRSIRDVSIEGFNTFLSKQKELPDEAYMTVVLFDDEYEVPIKAMPLQDVPALTRRTFVPRGWTALFDAIGKTINTYRDRSERTLCVILTDGEENRSKEYTRAEINELIEEQRKAGWEFIYLGANQDSFAVADSIGITYAANYAPTRKGVQEVYARASTATLGYRSTGAISNDSLNNKRSG